MLALAGGLQRSGFHRTKLPYIICLESVGLNLILKCENNVFQNYLHKPELVCGMTAELKLSKL